MGNRILLALVAVAVMTSGRSHAACPDFAAARTIRAETFPMAVAIGDFNTDGISDLAVANNFRRYRFDHSRYGRRRVIACRELRRRRSTQVGRHW